MVEIPRTKRVFYITLWFISFASAVFGAKSVLVCPNLTGEPTVSEVVTNLLGNTTTNEVLYALQSQGYDISQFQSFADAALKFTLPITSLFSTGVFKISYAQAGNLYSFNDVHIAYKRNFVMDLVCGNSFVSDRLAFLCDCDGGQLSVDGRLGTHCVKSSLCSDKTFADGQCSISWNPFKKGCLLINVRSDIDDESETIIQRSVHYQRVTPTLYDLWVMVQGSPNPSHMYQRTQVEQFVEDYLTPALKIIPTYAASLLLGYVIISNARDLADSPVMQLVMQGVYGLFLAFIVLAYILYRMSKRVVGRYGGPLAELAHIPVSFSILSMTLANPTILRTLKRAVWAFWHTGYPFGVPWAGKAYFAVCILLCVAVCRYFALFQADTASWHAMHYSIKLLGLALLGNGTSCVPLAVVLVLLGCFEEHIRHWLWMFYLTSNAITTKPTYKYLANGRMTMEEAEALGKSYTKVALARLRTHLAENPAQLDLVMDRFREGGKKEEAQLVSRFANGTYPGVPYTVDDQEGAEKHKGGGWLGWLGSVLMLAVVVGGAVVVVNKAGQQEL